MSSQRQQEKNAREALSQKVNPQNYRELVDPDKPERNLVILEALMKAFMLTSSEKEEALRFLFSHGLDFTKPCSFGATDTVHQFLSTELAWLRAGFRAGLNPNTVINRNPVLYSILQNYDEETVNQAQIVKMFLEFGFVPVPGTEEVMENLDRQWVDPEVNQSRVFLEKFVESIPKK